MMEYRDKRIIFISGIYEASTDEKLKIKWSNLWDCPSMRHTKFIKLRTWTGSNSTRNMFFSVKVDYENVVLY